MLDTNIIVHFVRKSEVWDRIRLQHDLFMTNPRPMYSVVTDGELRSLTRRWTWETQKLDDIRFAFTQCDRVGIDDESILDAYGLIDFRCRKRGIKLSKNDLWIAATAHAKNATLISCDKDYLPMSPEFFQFELIAESIT